MPVTRKPAKAPKSPEERVEDFNRAHELGTRVLYRSYPEAKPLPSKTVTLAWVLGQHTPVVMIEGVVGCVALTALEVLRADGGE